MPKKPTGPRFKLLGASAAAYPERPAPGILETFENRNAERDYWITFENPDFTSLCPVTGQPDFASVRIRYVPDQLCVETKSLKFYLAAYRNTKGFNEEIVNRILDDLVAACKPRQMEVVGDFAPRGGISVLVEASFPDPPF